MSNSEFESQVRELWSDESAVFECVQEAIKDDRFIKKVADTNAYSSLKEKALAWDLFMDLVGLEIIKRASDDA